MKLVIQLMGFQSGPLSETIPQLPSEFPGFSQVRVLVVGNEPVSGTGEISRVNCAGGRAEALRVGLESSLALGADVVVALEPGQLPSSGDWEKLTTPLREGQAHFAIGTPRHHRPSTLDRLSHRLSGTPSPRESVRAFSREALLSLRLTGAGNPDVELQFRVAQDRLPLATVELESSWAKSTPTWRWSTLIRETLASYALPLTLVAACLPIGMLLFLRPLPGLLTAVVGISALGLSTTATALQFWVNYRLEADLRELAPAPQ